MPQAPVPLEQVIFHPTGLHSRAYASDAALAWLGDPAYYQFSAPREGLYDQLPSLLFHELPPAHSADSSPEAVKATFRLAQAEREAARRFFQPFDTELFYLRLLPYQQQLTSSENLLTEFEGLLPIIRILPPPLAALFAQLLPFISRIARDLSQVSQLLTTFVEAPVTLRIRPPVLQEAPSAGLRGLGEGQLGVDLIIGNRFLDESQALELSVGPVPAGRTAEFLPAGTATQLLTALLAYFVPASAEVVWLIDIDPLPSPAAQPIYLGYNSYLA